MEVEGGSSTAGAGGSGDGSLLRQLGRSNLQPQELHLLDNYACGNNSTSGTTLSSTYTCTSGGSTLSSADPVGGGFLPIPDVYPRDEAERAKTVEYIKGLVLEFSCVATDDFSVLERWFSKLGVGWVLQLADVAPSGRHVSLQLQYSSGTWIRALLDITGSIRHTYDSLSCHFFEVTGSLGRVLEEGSVSDHYLQLTQFAQASILKMLPFLDAIVAPDVNTGSSKIVVAGAGAWAPAEKLQALIHVREALSKASQDFQSSFRYGSSEESQRIMDEICSLMLSKVGTLAEAIWNTIEQVRAGHLASMEDHASRGTQTPQGSPDIHRLTRAIVSYIKVLSTNCAIMHQIVDQAAQLCRYVPKIGNVSPFTSLVMEMLSCLEEKLAKWSQSFPDHSLRYLFLINNCYFIWLELNPTSALEFHMPVLTRKIDNYIATYLQLAWAPVLSCLYNSAPLCLGKYSPLANFESEFQKTCTAQKFWKVPDPELRKRLREAINDKVVSGFTRYLEYNNISNSRVTPRDLVDMIVELFEG